MTAHINSDVMTLSTCVRILRTDGVIDRFCDHDVDIVVSGQTGDDAIFNGTYIHDTVGYTRTNIESSNAMSADNLELQGLLDISGVTDINIRAGLYDKAGFHIFLVNHQANSDGIIKLRRGDMGVIEMTGGEVALELRGLMVRIQESILPLYAPDCRAQLGDTECQVALDVNAWAATTVYTAGQDFDAGVGDTVKAGTDNFRYFRAVQGGVSGASEPTWDTTIGNFTVESDAEMDNGAGSVTFTQIATVNDEIVRATGSWVTDGFSASDSIQILGTSSNNGTFTIAAISTTVNPDDTIEIAGDLIDDETIDAANFRLFRGSALQWETIQSRVLEGTGVTIASFSDNHDMFLTTTADHPTGWFDQGVITFVTGANAGLSRAITKWTLGTDRVETFLDFPFTITVGDQVRLITGCKKRIIEDCKTKFNNSHNHRGEAYVPKEDFVFSTPDPRECIT